MIDNPYFKDDPYIYSFDSLKYTGIELWQRLEQQLQTQPGSLPFDEIFYCNIETHGLLISSQLHYSGRIEFHYHRDNGIRTSRFRKAKKVAKSKGSSPPIASEKG